MNQQQYYKRKCMFLLIAIVIAAALILVIYFNGKDKSCDQCEIEFKTYRTFGQALSDPIIIKQNIPELYIEFIKNRCLITFDKQGGYRLNGL